MEDRVVRRPSFQFYPADWRNNANLRRCSPAARGIWVDVMCVLHDSDEYGVVRWPLNDLANSANAPIKLVRELVDKNVLKGGDKALAAPFIYVPRSGRKNGDPVTLLPTQAGPLWYSSRMVKDEYVRTIRGEASRFGEGNDATPNNASKASPKPTFGDGSTSSSSTTSSSLRSEDISSGSAEPKYPSEFEAAWLAYPDRPGRSKADACKAWKARRKEGVTVEALQSGVERYAAFCRACKTEPSFIKQPTTFFGPGEHYAADWTAPAPSAAGPRAAFGASKFAAAAAGIFDTPQQQGEVIDV
ncbi:hypothetical protein [Variovorax sp. GB1P17]|uniref:hypothetical protein n=1 Tax=Variovorax sp. GB1P17 TaxID=3443740 RepID=UPI003F4713AE